MRPAADKYPQEHDPHRGVRGDAAGRVPVGQSRRHLRAARHADRGHARQHGVRSGVRRQRGLRHLPRAQVHQRPRVIVIAQNIFCSIGFRLQTNSYNPKIYKDINVHNATCRSKLCLYLLNY